MYEETKKLHLIEEILKIENKELLAEVEIVLLSNKHLKERGGFSQFAGMMSNEEASALEKTIEEGCETINPDDWK